MAVFNRIFSLYQKSLEAAPAVASTMLKRQNLWPRRFSMAFQRVPETAGGRASRGFHHAETPLTGKAASACSKTAGSRANRGFHHAETSRPWLDVSPRDFSVAFQRVPENAGGRVSRGFHHAETPLTRNEASACFNTAGGRALKHRPGSVVWAIS